MLTIGISIKLSLHTQQRKISKGISNSEIKRVVQRGVKIRQKHGAILAKFQDLRVVYIKKEEIYYIITIID